MIPMLLQPQLQQVFADPESITHIEGTAHGRRPEDDRVYGPVLAFPQAGLEQGRAQARAAVRRLHEKAADVAVPLRLPDRVGELLDDPSQTVPTIASPVSATQHRQVPPDSSRPIIHAAQRSRNAGFASAIGAIPARNS